MFPPPINVGTSTQYKSGALGIGGVFQADNLAVFNRLKIKPLTTPPPSPTEGEIYYDTNSKSLKFYNGANWIFFDSGVAAAGCVTHACGEWNGIQCVPKTAGENGLSACRRCNGVSLDPVNVADNTKDTEGSSLCNLTCAKCSSGNCALQASNEDLFNECAQGLTSSDGCRSNYCSGITNSCGVQTGVDGGCPSCQSCLGGGFTCANTYVSASQDNNGPNTCNELHYRCDGSGNCTAPTTVGPSTCQGCEIGCSDSVCISSGYDGSTGNYCCIAYDGEDCTGTAHDAWDSCSYSCCLPGACNWTYGCNTKSKVCKCYSYVY